MILGQHVMPPSSGEISYRPGTTQAAADSLEVRLLGRGAHGSMPESSVDRVVMAASTVLRLQRKAPLSFADPHPCRHKERPALRGKGYSAVRLPRPGEQNAATFSSSARRPTRRGPVR